MAELQISQLDPKPIPVAATDQLGIDDNNAITYKILISDLEDYFDQQYVSLFGSTMSGALILNGDPSPDQPLGAATKQYVDASVVNATTTARCATTTN